MKSLRLAPLVASLLLVAAPTAPAQQRDDLARVRVQFPAASVERLETILAHATDDGVPRELLVEKAVEGVAKGHRPDVVIRAVSTLADEMRATVRLLGRDTPPPGLEKATDAIRHGVEPDVVRRLARTSPRDFPLFLQAIEDLLHAGVELETAQGVVLDAASSGMRSQEVLTLPQTVRRLVREGSSPIEAATTVRRSLTGRSTIPPSSPGILGRTGSPVGTTRRIPPPSPGPIPPS